MTIVPLPLPVRRPRVLLPARYRLLALWSLTVILSAGYLLFFTTGDLRAVMAPVLTTLNLALFFVAVLYKRDGELPVFESGTLWVMATTIYTVYPMMNFVLGGMRWVQPADYRLISYDPSPREMGAFTWNHVLYLATFVVVYLVVRARKRVPRTFATVPRSLRRAVIVSIVVVMALLMAVRLVLMPPEAALSPYEGGNFDYRADMPLIVLQALNISTNVVFALKLFFAILLLSRWRERRWRMVLFGWLLLEVLITTRSMSRATFVLLLVTLGIGYHRLVRPLPLRTAVLLGLLIVGGFAGFGLYRDTRGSVVDRRDLLIANNEFQGLYANAYDIHMRKHNRVLPDPPPQMKWSDLYNLIPSQFLPFQKWDPNEWYAGVMEIHNTGNRMMFGVMAQAMLGRGTIEVFFRGVAIALVLALLHRWYVRRAARFWPTALYAYVSVWTYYTFRSTSFFPVYFVVYYFCTAALIVLVVQFAGTRARRIARQIG